MVSRSKSSKTACLTTISIEGTTFNVGHTVTNQVYLRLRWKLRWISMSNNNLRFLFTIQTSAVHIRRGRKLLVGCLCEYEGASSRSCAFGSAAPRALHSCLDICIAVRYCRHCLDLIAETLSSGRAISLAKNHLRTLDLITDAD